MDRNRANRIRRERRHHRVRARVHGTPERPRLAVIRSVAHIHAQLIDDVAGRTLVAVYERHLAPAARRGTKTERAAALGTLLAEKAKAAGVTAAVLDRGAGRYHGRIQAFTDAARKGGLSL